MKRPFEALHHEGQLLRLRRLAQAALNQYDLTVIHMQRLVHRANTVFLVETRPDRNGTHQFILRVYGQDSPPLDMIRSEMEWLLALRRDTGVAAPEPAPARDGSLIVTAQIADVPTPRRCVLFRRVEGCFFDAGLTPAHLARVGELMATLHRHAEGFQPPVWFDRPRWTGQGLFGESSVLARRNGDGLKEPARAIFSAAAERVPRELAALDVGPSQYNLIHADLQQTNYLFHHGQARAIDFEDCCFGYFLFDMAITLFEVADRPQGPAMREAFFAGYSRIRPLPRNYEDGIRLFTAVRLVKRVNYLTNASSLHLQALAPGWVEYAKDWLGNYVAR